jgi:DNA-binding PadR family transcriptional regulator
LHRRFEPVSDELVLAAIDRAERHRRGVEREWATLSELTEHLGFVRTGWTTRQLRPQLGALAADGLLAAHRRHSREVWELTKKGRQRLEAWRRGGDATELPESPQHRIWRHARTDAAERIQEIEIEVRHCVVKGLALLDTRRRVKSDSWFELGRRLDSDCRSLGSATHCLYEWAEPEDTRADVDDHRDAGDEELEPAEQGRLRSLRQGRRWLRYRDDLGAEGGRARAAANGAVITVPAALVPDLRVGLHHLLGVAAEDVADITSRPGREQHPASLRSVRPEGRFVSPLSVSRLERYPLLIPARSASSPPPPPPRCRPPGGWLERVGPRRARGRGANDLGGAMHDDRAQPTVACRGPAVRDAGGDPDDLVGLHDARLLRAEKEGDRTLLRLATRCPVSRRARSGDPDVRVVPDGREDPRLSLPRERRRLRPVGLRYRSGRWVSHKTTNQSPQ